MVEAAMANEELMDEYLEGELTEEEIKGIRVHYIEHGNVPCSAVAHSN